MNRQHEAHQPVVRIEPVDSRFSCLIEEPGLEEPHYVMSAPPLPTTRPSTISFGRSRSTCSPAASGYEERRSGGSVTYLCLYCDYSLTAPRGAGD
jgi:hypothetical protein